MKINYSDEFFKRLNKTFFFFLFLILPIYAFSQDCTVNANVERSICPGGETGMAPDRFYLLGTSNAGSGFLQNPVWTQISGPAVNIVDPNLVQSLVTGAAPGNTYGFRLTAQCQDGSTIFDDVLITVKPLTLAKAGDDKTYCQGTYPLAGNPVGASETGTWSIQGGNNAGISISNPGSPTTNITVSGTTSGTTTLRWTINNTSSNCQSYDEVVITTLGGVMPVTAGSNVTLSNCYSSTQSYQLNGSYGGNENGSEEQKGVWTVVSGPTVPGFSNSNDNNTTVNGLVEGVYVLRWTVSGPCANGVAEVTITVPPPTADVTDVGDANLIYCDGRTSTVLQGTVPLYVNESVVWSQTGGPSATIQSPNSPSTVVSGMITIGTYNFVYTLNNSATGCTSTGNYNVTLEEIMSISGTDQVLACDVSSATIPVTTSGNGQLSWQIVDGPTRIIPNPFYPSYPTPTVNFSGNSLTVDNLNYSGTYIIRLIKAPNLGSQCETVYDDVYVTVSNQPDNSSAGTTQTLNCSSTSATLAGSIPTNGVGSWSQVSGPSEAIFNNVKNPQAQVTGLVNGRYEFRWTISGGAACSVTQDTVEVLVSSTTPTASEAGLDQTVCFGAPFVLQGNTPIIDETGTWTVTPSAGVVFSDVNDPNATVTGLAQNTVYTFTWTIVNGCGTSSSDVVITTTTTEGANADAGADQCLATGVTSISLTANNPSPGTGLWTKISGTGGTITNPTQFNTTVTGVSDGNYEFKWTVTNVGCSDGEDTVTITIAPTITVATAGPDQNFCGDTVTVTGNTPAAGESGLWEFVSGGDGPVITNPTSPTTTITGLTAGSWVYKWTISRGVCAVSSDSVQLNIDQAPSTAVAGPDQVVCNQTSVTLAATAPSVGSGIWSLVSGPNSPVFSNVASNTSTVSNLVTGEYILEWTTYTGINCPPSKDQVSIKVTEVAVAGSDFSTCLVGPLLLFGNPTSTGTWSYVSGGTTAPTITTTGNNSAAVTGLTPGVYVFRYTIPAQGSCPQSSDDIQVTVNGQITGTPNAGPDQTLCSAGSPTIQLDASPDTETAGTWTVLFGPSGGTFNDATSPNAIFTPSATGFGIYVFEWKVSSGTCSESDQVRVEYAASPSAAVIEGDNAICGSTTELTATTPTIGTGKWTQDSGPTTAVFSSTILPTTTVSNLTTTGGVYVFRWTVTNGAICTPTTDTVQITVTANLTTPNAGPDQTICQTEIATLAANAITVGSGQWSRLSGPAGTFSNNTSPTSTFTPTGGAGTYVLRWTSTNLSCSFTDDMSLTVDPLPTTSVAGSPFSVCQFESVNLNGNSPTVGTGLWSQVSGPTTVVFETPNSPTTAVLGTQTGSYVFQWTISNGSCPPSSSNVTVTINPLPPLAVAGPDQTICNISTVTLAGNNPSPATGLWSFVSPANGAIITSPTTFNTTVTNLPVGITRLKWTTSNGSCTPYSDEVNIIRPSDLITSPITSDTVICQGGTISLTTNPSGSIAPYTYQWQTSANGTSGWTNVSGQTNASFTTASSLVTGIYYYRVIVNSSCAQVTSNVAKLTIIADPVITTQPVGNTICSGATHTMTVAATTTNGAAGTIAYQWQSSTSSTSGFVNVTGGTGATSATYTTAALTSNLYYRVRVTQAGSGCETFTNPALVSVVTFTAQPSAPAPICIGGVVTVSVTASLGGGSGNITYQWQSSANGTSGWANVSGGTGSTTASYTSGGLSASTFYRCIVTSSTTNCSITSNAVQAVVVADPAISTQPTGGTICTGGTFTLTATATGGTPSLNYQWYSSADNISFALISGATSNTFTTPALTASTYYRVDVSATGNGCGVATSNSALVTVIVDPTVTQQPVGSTICSGATHTMNVVASSNPAGGALAYQWQSSANGTSGWANVTGGTGATSATYTTAALTSNLYYRVRITQGLNGCEVFSNATPVYVTRITTQPVTPAAICIGGIVNLNVVATLSGGAGTLSYQWQSNTGSSWVDEGNASATTANFTSNALSVTTRFRCIVTSSTTNCNLTSNEVTVTVVPDPSITTQPVGTTICSGANHTMSVVATNGTPGLTYQWLSSTNNSIFTAISGATSATYSTPNLTQTTYYRVDVSASGNGCTTINSSVATVEVLSDIKITADPQSTNVCSGSTANLSVAVSEGTGSYSYQWKTSNSVAGPFTDISGANASTYTTPVLTQNTFYQVVISDNGLGCDPITSKIAAVIIPSIVTQPATPATVCVGGTVSVSTLASANNGSATFAYQWQSSANGTSGWANVTDGTGANAASYTSGPLTVNTYFRCIITSSTPTCTLTTNVVMANVIPDPTIATQPTGGIICEGATFTLSATASNGSGSYSYQWQQSLDGTTGWANISGANATTYTTDVLNIDTFYRLQVTDSGIGCGVVNSSAALVEVSPDIKINTDPQSVNICSGTTTTLSVVVSEGTGAYSYQWKTSNFIAGPFIDISGANASTYTTPALTQNTFYQVLVSDSGLGCDPVTSEIAAVIIPSIVTQPLVPATVCVGGTISVSTLASANTGSATFAYQWQSSANGTSGWANVSDGTGANTPSYTSGPLAADTYFRCVITSSTPACTLTTNVVMATVIPDPTILTQPSGGNICEGGTFTLTASAADGSGGYAYQWQKSSDGIAAWSNIAGANSTSYTTDILNVDTYYRLQVTDSGIGCGVVNSDPAKVSVFESPIISAQPIDQEVCINQSVTFTVAATGNVPSSTLIYQWQTASALAGPYTDVTTGTGGTTASYTTPNYATAGNRYFRVLISQSQSGCQTISNQVTLNVFDAPVVPIGLVTQQPSCTNDFGTIAITNPDLGTGYEYSIDGGAFQASNIFENLTSGAKQITVRKVGLTTCVSNPANFTIFNKICAVPETFATISGDAGGDTDPLTILDSDTLDDDADNSVNSLGASPNVTVTINTALSSSVLIFDPLTNIITVPFGTPADDYILTYTICEVANPANCSTATETIVVTTAGIDARIDVVPFVVNGYTGQTNVINALTNDKLNSLQATTSNVIISIVTPAQPIVTGNNNVPVLNTATGNVSVPAGTVKGLYEIKYRICQVGNLTNCDQASILVQVGTTIINAEDDSNSHNINGYVGEANSFNAIIDANDTLDGVPITALNFNQITVTQYQAATPLYVGANVPVFSEATGNVSIPAGTPAGTYYIKYRICEKLNPANCDDASISIVVDPAPLEVNDDVVNNVNGYEGAVNVINAYTNALGADEFNGQVININLTGVLIPTIIAPATPINGGPVPELLIASGRVNIPAGTPAGQYQIKYRICEKLNTPNLPALIPSNCDDAIITINVIEPVIIADDDTVLSVNGYEGAPDVINAYDNDSLNNSVLDLSTITTTIISSPSAINGGPVPSFDTTTGLVSVAAGTPSGNYKFVYEICENLNAGNCDQAIISITVISAAISAVDDTNFSAINGFVGDPNAISALDNDTLNGIPVVLSNVTISNIVPAVSINGGAIPVLDPATGIVSVPPGTSAGSYTIGYRLSENLNQANFDTATITVTVEAPVIEANHNIVTGINGYVGAVNAIDVIVNDRLNLLPTDLTKVTITVDAPAVAINSGPVPVLEPLTGVVSIPAGTPAGNYQIDYTICEKLNPLNCNDASVFINVIAAPIVANDDDASGINGYVGATNVLNALTNDELNGVLVLPSQVVISDIVPATAINGSPVPVLNATMGIVEVPAGTAAGDYIIEYRLSEKLNLSNFDTALITINVIETVIIANDDSTGTINGYVGTANALNAITNDRLNGVDIDLTEITITALGTTAPLTATNGIVPILDTTTGIVSVPAGTSAGVYTIDYRITENLNPSNFDEAVITINVIPTSIDANDDFAEAINGFEGENNVVNTLANDTLNGVPVQFLEVDIQSLGTTVPVGSTNGVVPILNTFAGFVDVPAGTSAGTYIINYEICEKLNPTNCSQANIRIVVEEASIVALDDTIAGINGYEGADNVLNAFTDNDTYNGVLLTDVSLVTPTITSPATPINGGLVPSLDLVTGFVDVPAGTPAGAYQIGYSICENVNPTNCDEAVINIIVIEPTIVATDDAVGGIVGYTGANNVINAYANDELNNDPVVVADINRTLITAASSINGAPVPVLNLLTGNVDVPAGTHAGEYKIVYKICDKLNPTNCDEATITITVITAPIDAVDDAIANINGYEGAADVLNAFTDNDTYNGVLLTDASLVTPAIISPATPINGGMVPVLDLTTGFVSIPAGTPAGAYQIRYQICENFNPANCDEAFINVIVIEPTIVATDDAVAGIVGYTGANNVINAYANDELNNDPVVVADINRTLITAASSINGAPVPELNLLTGNVDVPAGTHAGEYKIVYKICDKLNPTNCDEATITINVITASIDAVDDTNAIAINGFVGTSNAVNVLDNDTLNSVLVISSEVTITNIIPAAPINGGLVPVLDGLTGIVSVPAGTAAGTYSISYQLNENLNLTNNDSAIATIIVDTPVIEANDDTVAGINGYVGTTNAIDVIANDRLNLLATDVTKVTITIDAPAVAINGGPVPVLEPLTGFVSVPPGTPAGNYQIDYTICEKLNELNCNDASVFVNVIAAPIDAIDDTTIDINGYVGEASVLNALTNDELNGILVVPSQVVVSNIVPATPINGSSVPVLDPVTGNVDVPAGTAAGIYTIQYRLSEKLNLTNFDTAVITINVIEATIIANNDIEVNVNGYVGAVNALNVLDNDSFNDSSIDSKKAKITAINISQITITVLSPANPINGNPNIPVLDTATGIVSVPAGTPAGLYQIQYRISENLNPSNADDAIVFITVTATTIEANNDTALNINGFEGQANVLNVIPNDNLNGVAVDLAEITIGLISPATAINGGLVPMLDLATGSVSVPAGTPSGTYTIRYSICENLNPSNCSEANAVVTVISGPILAVDDEALGINGLDGANNVVDVLLNDELDSSTPPTLSQVTISVLSPADKIDSDEVPVLDPATGFVSVPPGTSSGIYTIAYGICENLNSLNCSEAVIKIEVLQPAVELIKRGVFVDANGDGYAQPGEIIRYSFLVRNTGAIDLQNVMITDPKATIVGSPIAILTVGQSNFTNYTATYTLTQADINLGTVENQALVTAQPAIGSAIQDLSDSDDPTLAGKDDPTITLVNQFKEITLIKSGQLTGTGGAGSIINYSFTVKNTGNVLLTNVVIDDPLIGDNPIVVTPNVLAPGQIGTATASYTVTVPDVANGEVMNTAMVMGEAPDGSVVDDISDSNDPALTGDDDPTIIDLTMVPQIDIEKTATFNDENKNGYAEIGETITYNFTITNTGNVVLVNVVVSDTKEGVVLSGGPIVLRQGETDTNAFKGTYVLTKEDIEAGEVTNLATVNAVSPEGLTTTDKDEVTLTLNPCVVKIYNAVSPNNDTKNDFFKIQGIECYQDSYVEIYDRWGVLVYEVEGYDNNDETHRFNGFSEGRTTVKQSEGLPSGTYFYVITYKTFLGENIHQNGYLYLSR
ncbi:T9SS type B sorting domain-containing protein [Flavobacterium sp. GA093]|uniref:T9SS type B sorting domain-containing protein n=1 Tax=Flavobacterium hydrocarbonoxydans TaxID=2683249 RepID=A0A6I4NMI9_9FLAO|nr:gliding motility-associated C-terminal domain-containing protein [Flavobacterium hydrocarbonoxydans]MWB95626.1 T9SS type B sorting domain-containing protein [Flavobacterium hydrocarbonoxydans]